MSDAIVQKALSSLGKGFDLSSDFRLKYCKGDDRLILLNESDTRDLRVPGFGSFAGVSVDVKCDKGERTRYQTDILDFKQVRAPSETSIATSTAPNSNSEISIFVF